jgi:hypothetical protein
MTRDEIYMERSLVLAKLLLRCFRSRMGDLSLPGLYEMFGGEMIHPRARFRTYAAFASWIKKHPSLTVGFESKDTNREFAVLRLNEAAAMFVGAKTGESLHVDFQALRGAPEFMPWGDPIFTVMQHEEVV